MSLKETGHKIGQARAPNPLSASFQCSIDSNEIHYAPNSMALYQSCVLSRLPSFRSSCNRRSRQNSECAPLLLFLLMQSRNRPFLMRTLTLPSTYSKPQIWRIEADGTATFLSQIVKHSRAVNVVRFSPDGSYLQAAFVILRACSKLTLSFFRILGKYLATAGDGS